MTSRQRFAPLFTHVIVLIYVELGYQYLLMLDWVRKRLSSDLSYLKMCYYFQLAGTHPMGGDFCMQHNVLHLMK